MLKDKTVTVLGSIPVPSELRRLMLSAKPDTG